MLYSSSGNLWLPLLDKDFYDNRWSNMIREVLIDINPVKQGLRFLSGELVELHRVK